MYFIKQKLNTKSVYFKKALVVQCNKFTGMKKKNLNLSATIFIQIYTFFLRLQKFSPFKKYSFGKPLSFRRRKYKTIRQPQRQIYFVYEYNTFSFVFINYHSLSIGM